MFTKSKYLALSGMLLLGATIPTSVYAESLSLNIKVLQKYEGFVQFQLQAENISLESLQDVVIESNNQKISAIDYGDIEAGKSETRIVTLDWDPAQEPPALEWTITYYDGVGNTHTQTN